MKLPQLRIARTGEGIECLVYEPSFQSTECNGFTCFNEVSHFVHGICYAVALSNFVNYDESILLGSPQILFSDIGRGASKVGFPSGSTATSFDTDDIDSILKNRYTLNGTVVSRVKSFVSEAIREESLTTATEEGNKIKFFEELNSDPLLASVIPGLIEGPLEGFLDSLSGADLTYATDLLDVIQHKKKLVKVYIPPRVVDKFLKEGSALFAGSEILRNLQCLLVGKLLALASTAEIYSLISTTSDLNSAQKLTEKFSK